MQEVWTTCNVTCIKVGMIKLHNPSVRALYASWKCVIIIAILIFQSRRKCSLHWIMRFICVTEIIWSRWSRGGSQCQTESYLCPVPRNSCILSLVLFPLHFFCNTNVHFLCHKGNFTFQANVMIKLKFSLLN